MRARLLLLFTALLFPLQAAAQSAPEAGERVFIVTDYRYDPGPTPGDHDAGLSLCAGRCNALSVDYLNFTTPGGWRMIKVAAGRELAVELNSPTVGGDCICVADEYLVKADVLNNPSTWKDPTR